jgi:hypothetical protein
MINNTKYYHTFNKHYSTNLETESPIYNQILQQEQIELHKLSQLIQLEAHSGVVLDYNTDAVNCTFPNNKFPFELMEDVQLNGHYWDSHNQVHNIKLNIIKSVSSHQIYSSHYAPKSIMTLRVINGM